MDSIPKSETFLTPKRKSPLEEIVNKSSYCNLTASPSTLPPFSNINNTEPQLQIFRLPEIDTAPKCLSHDGIRHQDNIPTSIKPQILNNEPCVKFSSTKTDPIPAKTPRMKHNNKNYAYIPQPVPFFQSHSSNATKAKYNEKFTRYYEEPSRPTFGNDPVGFNYNEFHAKESKNKIKKAQAEADRIRNIQKTCDSHSENYFPPEMHAMYDMPQQTQRPYENTPAQKLFKDVPHNTVNETKQKLSKIQHKQTKEHFWLDSDPDVEHLPDGHTNKRPGIIPEMYGGCHSTPTTPHMTLLNRLRSVIRRIRRKKHKNIKVRTKTKLNQSYFNRGKKSEKETSQPSTEGNISSNVFENCTKSSDPPLHSFKSTNLSSLNPQEKGDNLSIPQSDQASFQYTGKPISCLTCFLSPSAYCKFCMSDTNIYSRRNQVRGGGNGQPTNTVPPTETLSNASTNVPTIDTPILIQDGSSHINDIKVTEGEVIMMQSENPLLTVGLGFSVKRNELECLNEGTMLWNNVIDAYISLLIKREGWQNVGYLSTDFIRYEGYQRSSPTGSYITGPDGRFIPEFVVHQEQLKHISPNAQFIINSVHLNDHYFLIKIGLMEKCIEIFDSLAISSDRIRILESVGNCLVHALQLQYGSCEDWKINIIGNMPLQRNGVDCGVHVIRNFMCLADPTKELIENEISNLRICIRQDFEDFRLKLLRLTPIPSAPYIEGTTPNTDFYWKTSLPPVLHISSEPPWSPQSNSTPSSTKSSPLKDYWHGPPIDRPTSNPKQQAKTSDVPCDKQEAEYIKVDILTEDQADVILGHKPVIYLDKPAPDVSLQCAVCYKSFGTTKNLLYKNSEVQEKNKTNPSPIELLTEIKTWANVGWITSAKYVCRSCYERLKQITSTRQEVTVIVAALYSSRDAVTNGLFSELQVKKQIQGKCYHCMGSTVPFSKLSTKPGHCNKTLKQIALELTSAKSPITDETDVIKICKYCRGQLERFQRALDKTNKVTSSIFKQKAISDLPITPPPKKPHARSATEKTPTGITPISKKPRTPLARSSSDLCKCCGTISADPFMYHQDSVLEEIGSIQMLLLEVQNKTGFQNQQPSSEHVCRFCLDRQSKIFSRIRKIQSTKVQLRNYGNSAGHGGVLSYIKGKDIPLRKCMNCCSEINVHSLVATSRSGFAAFTLLQKISECEPILSVLDVSQLNEYKLCFTCLFLLENVVDYLKDIKNLEKEYAEGLKNETRNQVEADLFMELGDSMDVTGLNTLLGSTNVSSPMNKEVLISITECLKQEVKLFIAKSGLTFSTLPTIKDAEIFAIEKVRELITNDCPLLNQMFRCLCGNEDQPLSTASIFLMSSIIFEGNQNCNLLQRLFGFILWKEGMSAKMFVLMNHLHISMSMDAIRNLADRWLIECEQEAFKWKEDVECNVREAYPSIESITRKLFEEKKIATLSIAYDNLNYNPEIRHQGLFAGTPMVNWTIQVLIRNRISPSYEKNSEISPASSVSIDKFLLSEKEKEIRNSAIVEELQRILCRNFEFFRKNKFEELIDNRKLPFQKQSSMKSEYIPLTLSEENEGTIVGNVRLLDDLTKYIPREGNRLIPTVVHGDGMTVSNITSSINVRSTSIVPEKTLQHFFPVFGLFHKRAVGLDDLAKTFGIDACLDSPGSLGAIKRLMRIMKAESGKTFNQMFDLAETTMEGLACLAFMEVIKLPTLGDTPTTNIDLKDRDQCKKYMQQISQKVADMINFEYNILSSDKLSCSCQLIIKKEPLLRCANPVCKTKPYFHEKCNSDFSQVDDQDWVFCSWGCRKSAGDMRGYYSRALLHACLVQIIRRHAIRQNDTELMMIFDKEDLLEFFTRHHPKYFGFVHNLILSQNDCVPKHVAEDILHNRTVNTSGKPNCNIANDLFVEHNVGDTKEDMKNIPGHLNRDAINRKTKLSRVFGSVKDLFFKITGTRNVTSKPKRRDLTAEVQQFVHALEEGRLFWSSGVIHRSHPGYETFNYRPDINLDKFKESIDSLSTKWDLNSQIRAHFVDDDSTKAKCLNPPIYIRTQEFGPMFTWTMKKKLAVESESWTKVASMYPLVDTPTDLQFQIILSLMEDDSAVCLPTAMGKSLCYIGVGLMHHVNGKNKSTTVLIVSPLNSIISDQCKALENMGLEGIHLTESNLTETSKRISSGSHLTYVFASPETLANGLIRMELMKWKVMFLGIDEAHLIRTWGKDFRKGMNLLGELRSIMKCRIGTFSATFTDEDLTHIQKVLMMPFCNVFAALPNRPNIFIARRSPSEIPAFYKHICDDIRTHGPHSKKIVIYVETYDELLKCYNRIMSDLKGYAYAGNVNSAFTSMIATYSGGHDEDTKEYIAAVVKNPDSIHRVIISTVSFGLGVDIPDISLVVTLSGKKTDTAQRWQEAGRAGRRSQPAVYLSFGKFPRICLRQFYLMEFDLESENMIDLNFAFHSEPCSKDCDFCFCEHCLCCDYCCLINCNCSGRKDRINLLFPTWQLKPAKK